LRLVVLIRNSAIRSSEEILPSTVLLIADDGTFFGSGVAGEYYGRPNTGGIFAALGRPKWQG